MTFEPPPKREYFESKRKYKETKVKIAVTTYNTIRNKELNLESKQKERPKEMHSLYNSI